MKKQRQSGLPKVTRQVRGIQWGYKPRPPDMLRSSSNRCLELGELKGLVLCPASSPQGPSPRSPAVQLTSVTILPARYPRSHCSPSAAPPAQSGLRVPPSPHTASPSLLRPQYLPLQLLRQLPGFSISTLSCLPFSLYIPTGLKSCHIHV